ncbi:MAG: hypothetical protein R3B83_02970 [Nitrospirales bacterium]|nr:hypothetical protein [Nitrospirales bacterium]
MTPHPGKMARLMGDPYPPNALMKTASIAEQEQLSNIEPLWFSKARERLVAEPGKHRNLPDRKSEVGLSRDG